MLVHYFGSSTVNGSNFSLSIKLEKSNCRTVFSCLKSAIFSFVLSINLCLTALTREYPKKGNTKDTLQHRIFSYYKGKEIPYLVL